METSIQNSSASVEEEMLKWNYQCKMAADLQYTTSCDGSISISFGEDMMAGFVAAGSAKY